MPFFFPIHFSREVPMFWMRYGKERVCSLPPLCMLRTSALFPGVGKATVTSMRNSKSGEFCRSRRGHREQFSGMSPPSCQANLVFDRSLFATILAAASFGRGVLKWQSIGSLCHCKNDGGHSPSRSRTSLIQPRSLRSRSSSLNCWTWRTSGNAKRHLELSGSMRIFGVASCG